MAVEKTRPASEVRKDLEAMGHKVTYSELGIALGLTGRVTGSTDIVGGNRHIAGKLAAFRAASIEVVKPSAETPATPKAVASPRKRSSSAAKGKRVLDARNSRRVKLDFSLSPLDRDSLLKVQTEISELRKKVAWTPPANWDPAVKVGTLPGTNKYMTPKGLVDNVPAGDIRQMRSGMISWKFPEVRVPYRTREKWAKQLEGLYFQAESCRLCGKPIEPSHGPEMAQVFGLLSGRYILPYIDWPFENGTQQELRFRRLHHLHSLWEDQLAVINTKMDKATDEELFSALKAEAQNILERAERNRPGQYSYDNILEALDEVLELWEQEEG